MNRRAFLGWLMALPFMPLACGKSMKSRPDVIRASAYRCTYNGHVIHHKTGAMLTLPSRRDEYGKYVWTIES